MKKFSSIALTALFACVLFGCENTDNQIQYKVMVYANDTITLSREPYFAKDNELLKYVHAELSKINEQYESQYFTEERKAMDAFDQSVDQINALKITVDDIIASRRDFGASGFLIQGYSVITKDGAKLKKSRIFDFSYTSNTRIECKDEININTEIAKSHKGIQPVTVYDDVAKLGILGWTLYNKETGEVSTAKLIDNVEVNKEAVGITTFDVSFYAEQGVDAGNYYLLVTFFNFDDPQKDSFDLMINVTHKTRTN